MPRISQVTLFMLLAGGVVRLDGQEIQRTLTLTEDRRIDTKVDPGQSILWATVDRTGRAIVAVSDGKGATLAFADRNGLWGSGGQASHGIPNFRSATTHGWLSDTLWLFDPGTHFLTLISPDGKVARTEQVAPTSPSGTPGGKPVPAIKFPIVLALYSDHSMVETGLPSRSPPVYPGLLPLEDNESALLRVSTARTAPRLLHVRRDERCLKLVDAGGFAGNFRVPLCPAELETISDDGQYLLYAVPEISEVAGTYRVTLQTAKGDTLYSLRRQFPARPVPTRVADSIRNALRSRFPNPDLAKAFFAEVQIPSSFPGVAKLVAATDGTSWLQRENDDGSSTWTVLDTKGATIGAVSLPAGTTLIMPSRQAIWVLSNGPGDRRLTRYHLSE